MQPRSTTLIVEPIGPELLLRLMLGSTVSVACAFAIPHAAVMMWDSFGCGRHSIGEGAGAGRVS